MPHLRADQVAVTVTILIVAVSVVVALGVGLTLFGWLFRDADDSDREFQSYVSRYRFFPWWASKFGFLLAVSAGAGALTLRLLFLGLQHLFPSH